MQKKTSMVYVVICLFSLFILSACSKSGEEKELTQTAVKTVQESTPKEIKDETSADGKKLIIDAPVELGNIMKVSEINLAFSEEKLSKIVDELIYSKYPDAVKNSEDTYTTYWCSSADPSTNVSVVADISGRVSYMDKNRDLSCGLSETEHLLEDGFITELTPSNMNLSTQEAVQEAANFLSKYSCFTFSPWNVMAANNSDPDKSGYYYISMEAAFDGIPICHRTNPGELGIDAYALLSNEGIFQFEGGLLLEPTEVKPVEHLVPLDDIISNVKESFSLLFTGDLVKIDRISLKYAPEQLEEGGVRLRPAWCFSCVDSRNETDAAGNENEIKLSLEYVIYADDGTFCALF